MLSSNPVSLFSARNKLLLLVDTMQMRSLNSFFQVLCLSILICLCVWHCSFGFVAAVPLMGEAPVGGVLGPQSGLLAVPVALNDEQLLGLLLASPLYQKLLRIKELVQSGARAKSAGLSSSSSLTEFMDPLDSKWSSDDQHDPLPVDQVCLLELFTVLSCAVLPIFPTRSAPTFAFSLVLWMQLQFDNEMLKHVLIQPVIVG